MNFQSILFLKLCLNYTNSKLTNNFIINIIFTKSSFQLNSDEYTITYKIFETAKETGNLILSYSGILKGFSKE